MNRSDSPLTSRARILYAAVADALLILVFAAIGRASHAEGDAVSGILSTAWPFLAAAVLGWAAARLWRNPLSLWPGALPMWAITVVGGMALRIASGRTAEIPFVIVTAIVLAIFLLGHRAAAAAVLRRHDRSDASAVR